MADVVEPSKEGTVDWDASKSFFTGKAKSIEEGTEETETSADGTTQEPEVVEVSIKGRKIKVAADDAAAIEAWRREVRERDGRLGGENAQMRDRLARLEGAVETIHRTPAREPEEPQPPPDTLAHEDFSEWRRQYDRYHSAKMAKLEADLEERYTRDKNETQALSEQQRRDLAWSSKFYSDHPSFDDPRIKRIVGAVYTEHAATVVAAGDVAEQHERLAELVEEELVALKRAGKTVTDTKRPPRLEGGSIPTPGGRPATEPARAAVSAASWSAKKRASMRGGK